MPEDKRCLTNGEEVTEDRLELKENGQQKDYVVICPEDRAKGFVRPYRDEYIHKKCGGTTTMGRQIAETYARDPKFYSGTFCCHCGKHFPVAEFRWLDTDQDVGS